MELKELVKRVRDAVDEGIDEGLRFVDVPTPCGCVEVGIDYRRQEYEFVMAYSSRVPGNEHPNIEGFLEERLQPIPYVSDGEDEYSGDFPPLGSRRRSWIDVV